MKKVCLIGAGAIGGYFIWAFDQKYPLTIIADGSRKERLEKGITINNKVYYPTVKTSKEAGIQDIVFIATKYAALNEAIDYLEDLVGENTTVFSLLNGVDSEDLIKERIGNHVNYSLMRIASRRIGNDIFFNEQENRGFYYGKESKEIVEDVISQTRLSHHEMEDIYKDMWVKYAANITNNLVQAILQVPHGLYEDSKHGYFMASKLYEEVRKVAKYKGIELDEKMMLFNGAPKSAKYSTLQDIEAKRHTEIDMFLGVLLNMAKEYNLETPYCEYTYHLIKALEEKNDRKFEY